MTKQDLYALDEMVYMQIQTDRRNKESETKAFFDGAEKGAEMMMKAVKSYLTKEQESESDTK